MTAEMSLVGSIRTAFEPTGLRLDAETEFRTSVQVALMLIAIKLEEMSGKEW